MSAAPDDASPAVPGSPTAAEELVSLLNDAGRTIAVAESLTGGLVVSALVGVPGASSCVRGGLVAYATDVKARLLGVSAQILEREGAVHPDVARAMALGVRTLLGADYGVATTGVAGPDPQDGVPPGTYHVAVAGPATVDVHSVAGPATVDVHSVADGPTGRDRVRRESMDAALGLALRIIRADVPGTGADGAML